MFFYEKKLQYPVKIATPNPKLASYIISQYGGPDGELGASLRYLSQRYSMPYPELQGLLTDIGTEDMLRSSGAAVGQFPLNGFPRLPVNDRDVVIPNDHQPLLPPVVPLFVSEVIRGIGLFLYQVAAVFLVFQDFPYRSG